jgi:hypothetical protein
MKDAPEPFALPTHCACCGAFLMGGATVHKTDCPILKLIEEFKVDLRTPEKEAPHESD